MQIGPYANLVLPRNSAVLSACLTACFQGPLRPCKQPRPRLHPALHPIIFLIWCSRTLQWRGFRVASPACGGTAHAGMLGAWLLILYITDNHSTTSCSDSARWPFTSATGSTPKPARSVAPSRWRTPTRCPTTPRPWRLPSISNRWMWCVSWRTPVWNRTCTKGGGQPAGPPGLRVRRRAVVWPRHRPRRAHPIRFQAQCDYVCRLARP